MDWGKLLDETEDDMSGFGSNVSRWFRKMVLRRDDDKARVEPVQEQGPVDPMRGRRTDTMGAFSNPRRVIGLYTVLPLPPSHNAMRGIGRKW